MKDNPAVPDWMLWRREDTLAEVTGFTPLLAQWYASTHPTQLKLYEYLDWLRSRIGPIQTETGPLFLHLRIDVVKAERLLSQYDLENFLTPLFGSRCLDPKPFVFVSAEKRVGGGSVLQVGRAEPGSAVQEESQWSYFEWSAPSLTRWKEDLRQRLASDLVEPAAAGPIEVRLAWKCSRSRNWVNLWKATGDAMGPILGEYPHVRNISPKDDRIVSLEFHRDERAIGHALAVGIWWRLRTARSNP